MTERFELQLGADVLVRSLGGEWMEHNPKKPWRVTGIITDTIIERIEVFHPDFGARVMSPRDVRLVEHEDERPKTRRARFRLETRLDGARGGTVIIEQSAVSDRSWFRVRPKGRRRTYDLLLADVAQMVLQHVVKSELKAAKKEKVRRKR